MAGLCVNQFDVFSKGFSDVGSTASRFPAACAPRNCRGARVGAAPNLPPLRLGAKGGAKRSAECRACRAGRTARLEDYEYDLYELLGVEKDARAEDIKRAYRWLQKRCHPDVAGAGGHDMAILLNDAYSVLSDPDCRASYDEICAENKIFAGYTGNPLFSKWFGKPGESRAVFVEETRCIGCLKCALIAPNTFGIESKYGRARACNQWLDEEHTIRDAIRACPVDCISWVNRDLLPALEFIMSKQPRLPTAINPYSYVGVRRENVFVGADRFLKKFAKREELRTSGSQETSAQRVARMAAAEGIHTKSGRWWHGLTGFPNLTFSNLWDPATTRISQGALIPVSSVRPTRNTEFVDTKGRFSHDDDLQPLLEAARSLRRRVKCSGASKSTVGEEEYWTPMEPISCPLPLRSASSSAATRKTSERDWAFDPAGAWSGRAPLKELGKMPARVAELVSAIPIAVAVGAAVLVGMSGGSDVARSEPGQVVAGPLPPSITSSIVMHMLLTAAVWYVIAGVVCAGAVLLSTALVGTSKSPDR